MTFRSGPHKAVSRAAERGGPRPAPRSGRKELPDYEKPLPKTGEARLWRTLTNGDRVEMILHGNYSRTGTIDERTPDGTTVWIILDHGMGRIAVIQGDPAALVPLE